MFFGRDYFAGCWRFIDGKLVFFRLIYSLGSAATALGLGNLLTTFIRNAVTDEKIQRFERVEKMDERNIRIREKTGYSVSKIMNIAICLLILVLGFMKADKLPILLLAALLFLQFVLAVAYSNYYSKKI